MEEQLPDGDWSPSGQVNSCKVSPKAGCSAWSNFPRKKKERKRKKKESLVWKIAGMFFYDDDDDDASLLMPPMGWSVFTEGPSHNRGYRQIHSVVLFQTAFLSLLMRRFDNKTTVIVGLCFEMLQLFMIGLFPQHW